MRVGYLPLEIHIHFSIRLSKMWMIDLACIFLDVTGQEKVAIILSNHSYINDHEIP